MPDRHTKRERDRAIQEAIALITNYRGAAQGIPAASFRVQSDPTLYVHILALIASIAIATIDELGGDGDAFLRHYGEQAAEALAHD